MSNIDKRALREAAEKATPGDWKYSTFDCAITDDTSSLAIVRMDSGHLNDEQSALNGAFIAAANPASVLALLDELEAADKQIAEQRETLLACRSYVMQCARLGDAHASGVLQAIDRSAAGKGEAS